MEYFETQFVAATGGGAYSLRVVGDVLGGRLGKRGMEAVVEYELGYEQHLAHRFPVVTLCRYDLRRCSGQQVLDVLKCHKNDFTYPAERLLT